MDHKQRLLSRVPLFARLRPSGLEEVARLADEVDVPADTELTHEGRRGGEFFVIIDGEVAIRRDGAPVRTLGAGEFLGEIALIDGGPRSATATTTVPTRLLVLGSREFHTLIGDHADVRIAVLEALAERVRNLDRQAAH